MSNIDNQLASIGGFDLDPDDVKRIRYMPDTKKQTDDLIEYNMHLYEQGYDLLQICYGVYLYRQGLVDDNTMMHGRINGRWITLFAYNISNAYDLTSYAIENRKESFPPMSYIAVKLVALIFQSKGFPALYSFVEPFFPGRDDKDSKKRNALEPVLDYALRLNSPCEIKIGQRKYNKTKFWTCDLSIDGHTGNGYGIEKDEAIDMALKHLKYIVKLRNSSSDALSFHNNADPIVEPERIPVLEKCLDILGVKTNNLSPVLINRALSFDALDKSVIGQGSLPAIGSAIVDLVCSEYVFNTCLGDDPGQEVGRMKRFPYLVQNLSKDNMTFLNSATKAVNRGDILEPIIKSLCAALWIDSVETGNRKLSDDTSEFVLTCALGSGRKKVVKDKPAPTNYLQIVTNMAERNDIGLEYTETLYQDDSSLVELVAEDDKWRESETGNGKNTDQALNNAARNLMLKLIPHFKKQEKELMILEKYAPVKRRVYEEPARENDENLPRFRPAPTFKKDNVPFFKKRETLYVRKNLSNCRRYNHRIVSVTGILKQQFGEEVTLNVNYCANCQKYFISYDEYLHYRELYGPILGRIIFTSGDYIDTDFGQMSSESVLHICGYNVGQTDELSESERHAILESVMLNGIMSKPRVMEYLQSFINRNKNTDRNDTAVQKWKDDLDWVRAFNEKQQKRVIISEIKR